MPNMFLGFPVPRAKIAEMIQGYAPPSEHASWHLPSGSDPIVNPEDISSGQYVKWNGTKFLGGDPAGGGGISNLFDAQGFYFSTNFESLDGFSTTLDDATIDLYHDSVELTTGTSYGARAIFSKTIAAKPYNNGNYLKWQNGKKFRTTIYYNVPSGNIGKLWIQLGAASNVQPYGHSIAFLFDNRTINAHLSNGEYWEDEQIGTIPSENGQTKFYLNGVLKTTLSTYPPIGTDNAHVLMNIILENAGNPKSLDLLISYFISWHGLSS
jgi:hypothetical protein